MYPVDLYRNSQTDFMVCGQCFKVIFSKYKNINKSTEVVRLKII